jgi:hypothetical protein
MKFKKAQGEEGRADAMSAEQWKCTRLPKFALKICVDDIYSADETGLFYRATPKGSLSYRHATLSGSKEAMVCATFSCCSNMSGTYKRKLLVNGENAKPWCFKGTNMGSLPVLYSATKNPWMT